MTDAAEALTCARLYVEEELDATAIGRRLGCHRKTVTKRLAAVGIRPEKGRARRTGPATIAAIAALTDAGLSQRAIGAQLGIASPTVGRWQPRLRLAEVSAARLFARRGL